MPKQFICPLSQVRGGDGYPCIQERCAWWMKAQDRHGNELGGCAVNLAALGFKEAYEAIMPAHVAPSSKG